MHINFLHRSTTGFVTGRQKVTPSSQVDPHGIVDMPDAAIKDRHRVEKKPPRAGRLESGSP